MSKPQQLSLIVDDQAGAIIYAGGQWTTSSLSAWYNGTSLYPEFALTHPGTYGNLSMAFQGTSISFFGNTPPNFADSQILTVSIDNQTQYNTSYNDPAPQSYRQWYTSPTLPDGNHSIALSHISSTSLDFAVVTAGPNTPIGGQRVIVDNEDPSVQYSGSWKRSTDPFNAGALPDGFPFHNSTHQSNTPGDSLTFRFSGSSAAIYGIFTWSSLGILEITYTLDGAPLTQSYSVTPASAEFINNAGQQSNFLFFSYDFLSAKDHTLTISIAQAVNQTFALDYITYRPTFGSLKDMPDLLAGTSSSGGASNGTSSGSDAGSTDPSGSSSSPTADTPVGAIVGGVLGGLLLLVTIIGIIWYYYRKRRLIRYQNPEERPPHERINPFTSVNNVAVIDQSTRPLTNLPTFVAANVVQPNYGHGINASSSTGNIRNVNAVGGKPRRYLASTAPTNSPQDLRTVHSSQDLRSTTSGYMPMTPPSSHESSSADRTGQDGELEGVAPPAYDDLSRSPARAVDLRPEKS